MTLEEIKNILENPLSKITEGEMDYIHHKESKVEQLYWYGDRFKAPASVSVHYDSFQDIQSVSFHLSGDGYAYITWHVPIRDLSENHLKYFILGVDTHYSYRKEMLKFRSDNGRVNIPKDFIREERLKELLDE